jgi:hypothetical protein
MTRDWAADLARRYIEATLNVAVEVWDEAGRQGAHDLRYELEGRSVAVEVKLVVDEEYRALERLIIDTGYVQDNRLSRMWDIRLRRSARFNRVMREIPNILIRLEHIGWQDEPLWQLRNVDDATEETLEQLRITGLWSHPPTPKHPPGFYLMPEPWGDWNKGIEELPGFVSDLLAGPRMERLRRQLANAEVDDRQAFLFLGWEYMEAFPLHQAGSREMPLTPPRLPESLNGLWLASLSESTRVLGWVPDRGWFEGSTRSRHEQP